MLRGRYVGWLDPALFASPIRSATMLLFVSGVRALAVVIGPMGLYVSIGSFKSSTPMGS